MTFAAVLAWPRPRVVLADLRHELRPESSGMRILGSRPTAAWRCASAPGLLRHMRRANQPAEAGLIITRRTQATGRSGASHEVRSPTAFTGPARLSAGATCRTSRFGLCRPFSVGRRPLRVYADGPLNRPSLVLPAARVNRPGGSRASGRSSAATACHGSFILRSCESRCSGPVFWQPWLGLAGRAPPSEAFAFLARSRRRSWGLLVLRSVAPTRGSADHRPTQPTCRSSAHRPDVFCSGAPPGNLERWFPGRQRSA